MAYHQSNRTRSHRPHQDQEHQANADQRGKTNVSRTPTTGHGKPRAQSDGYARVLRKYDERGNVVGEAFLDEEY